MLACPGCGADLKYDINQGKLVCDYCSTDYSPTDDRLKQKAAQEAQQADQTNPMNSPVMKWFFPIFSVWICATSNAAFSIYWMAANVIQIVQQLAVNWYFERQDAKAAELAAAQDIDD